MARHIGRRGKNKRRPMSEINVVPYIDVMLVLLVIFMMTTPLLSQGVKVDLPKEKTEALAQKDKEPIIVSVNAQGQYFVNLAAKPNEMLDGLAVQSLVRATLEKDASDPENIRPVLVKADQSVRYGDVVKIMALLQQAGAGSLGLVTEEGQVTDQSKEHITSSGGSAWRSA